ncbi:copper transporter [Thermovenabulum gondwanense]|uniref:copper transporter n=1 Tax=Thermovenabulum gondwanense TaxID=520767 RepID=UPI001656BF41|nr:copper transporter [Thermovenabulum gondwanense]
MTVSIFISFTLGLLTGFSINGSEVIAYQQQDTIEQLENTLNKLKEVNKKLNADMKEIIKKQKEDCAFLEAHFADIFKNKLIGEKIVILTSGKNNVEILLDSLKKTGAGIEIKNLDEKTFFPVVCDFIILQKDKDENNNDLDGIIKFLKRYKQNFVVVQDYPATDEEKKYYAREKIFYVDEINNVVKKVKLILFLSK